MTGLSTASDVVKACVFASRQSGQMVGAHTGFDLTEVMHKAAIRDRPTAFGECDYVRPAVVAGSRVAISPERSLPDPARRFVAAILDDVSLRKRVAVAAEIAKRLTLYPSTSRTRSWSECGLLSASAPTKIHSAPLLRGKPILLGEEE